MNDTATGNFWSYNIGQAEKGFLKVAKSIPCIKWMRHREYMLIAMN